MGPGHHASRRYHPREAPAVTADRCPLFAAVCSPRVPVRKDVTNPTRH